MEFKNFTKKFTAIALAGVLTFGGVAYANGDTTPTTKGTELTGTIANGSNAYSEVPDIVKEVTGGNSFGGGTFNYTIESLPGTDQYKGYTGRPAANLIKLTDGEIVLAKDVRTGSEPLIVDQTVVDTVLPGVYRFKITEQPSGISGMTDDPIKEQFIDAFVTTTNGTDRNIQYYIVHDGTNKKALKFTNTLAQEDIVITKNITGNQANKTDKFSFEFTVTPKSGTINTNITWKLNDGDVTPVAAASGVNGVTTFKFDEIGNEDKITVDGLAAEDTVTIKETDTKNYGGYEVTVNNGTDLTSNTELGTNGVEVTVNGNSADITWTNNRSAEIPTGVISNALPFILVIAAAGFFAFIYFRRDKEEEEAR